VPTKEELEKGFKLGDWEVFPGRHELHRGAEVVKAEPKQIRVLVSLAMRDGEVVTRDELVDECWDGRATADEPINRSISQLRHHLGDEKPYQYIDVVVKAGYRLKQPVILSHSLDSNSPDSNRKASPVKPQLSLLWAAVVSLAIVALLAWKLAPVSTEPVTSIAVLPFSNLSGDAGNAYIASGFKEELVHTLQNASELAIKNVQVVTEDVSAPEVGASLGVDSVLLGALRIEGDELRFGYQLVRVADGFNLDSGQVAGPRERLFELQEELARLVRSHFVGDSGQQLLSSSRPENSLAYDRYIFGQHLLERRGNAGNLEDAIALFEESLALDPGYGPAYLALAEIYVLLPEYRGEDLVESHNKAIEIVTEGMHADAAIADAAAAVFGFVYHKQKKWIEAEQAFKVATRAAAVESNAFNWYSLMLGSVGRLDAALEQALAALEIDPSSAVINGRVAIAYTWIGDNENAVHYFSRVRKLGGNTATNLYANALLLLRRGDVDGARELTSVGVEISDGSGEWLAPVFEAFADPALTATALAELDRAAADNDVELQVEVTARMILGDVDGALRVARYLARPGQAFETELLFLPEFRQLRERPEFLELMSDLGVTEYWQRSGCIWKNLNVECN
jgi:DNA-binding winged helix-turn-helix (wHTH) protein/TolB-like protein/Tfp pilus assembly protein PilF